MYRSLNIRVSFCLLIFTILGLLGNIAEGRQIPAYSELSETLESLFHNYDKAVAPQVHYLRPVPVYLKVTVDYIFNDAIFRTGTLSSLLTLESRWSDERLSWQPTKQRTLTVSPSLVWQPSFYFENSDSSPSSWESVIRLDYNGNLVRFQKVQLTTYCPSSKFAFQFSCPILVKAHPYSSTQERLTITDFKVNHNFPNLSWNVEVNTNDTRIHEDPVKLVLDLERKN
ncbi:acetylcholine receptor subunit beta-like [Argonauta hians]